MKRALFLLPLIALGLFLSVLFKPAPAETAAAHAVYATVPIPAAPVAPTCSSIELDKAVARLGEDPSKFSFTALSEGILGEAYLDTDTVRIAKDAPCELIETIVIHEWMHLLQGRKYTDAYAAYGADIEMVADCGSMLMGSTYTPYVTANHGCNNYQLQAARSLLGDHLRTDRK